MTESTVASPSSALVAPDPVWVYRAKLDESSRTALESHGRAIWQVAATALRIHGVAAPRLEVWVTDSVMGDAQQALTEFGAGTEHRGDGERIGGVVAGKTVMSADATVAVVLLDQRFIAPPHTLELLTTLFAVAHEMSHVVRDSCRNAAGIEIDDDLSRPWGIAAIAAVNAAEEYRCDRLAAALLRMAIFINDGDGNPIDFEPLLRDWHVGSIPEALERTAPTLEREVHRYRIGSIGLEQLWAMVTRTTIEFLIFMAHVEGTTSTQGRVFDDIDHLACSLFRPVVQPLVEHLLSTDLLPPLDAWAEDRQALKEIGTGGLIEVWRRLGLTFEPMGDGFFLHVTDPERGPWPR